MIIYVLANEVDTARGGEGGDFALRTEGFEQMRARIRLQSITIPGTRVSCPAGVRAVREKVKGTVKFRSLLIVLCAVGATSGCHRAPKPKPQAAAVAVESGEIDRRLSASEINVGDTAYEPLLLRGFYASEGDWRWTARVFAASLVSPPGGGETYVTMDFSMPPKTMEGAPGLTITARVNGIEVGRRRYTKAGRHDFGAPVPAKALAQQPAVVEFELDRAYRPTPSDNELGVVVVSIKLTHGADAVLDRDAETAMARQGYQYLLAKRKLEIPADKQTEMMKLFHQVPIWRNMFYEGIPIAKNPLDLWMMQQIIQEIQPDLIIETGTMKGGSALYWAGVLNNMGLVNSRVLTVDILDEPRDAASRPLWKKYVTFFHGSSTDPAIVAQMAKAAQGRKTIVTLDSDHSMGHVLNELNAYAPLVSRASYMVVEDTHLDGVPTDPTFGPGPFAAVRTFLGTKAGKQFDQDFTREAYVMTFNPGGWLRRK